MSKQSHFYATKDDLLTVTERVESKFPVKYIRSGHVTKLPPETFQSAVQIPNLGIATNATGICCEAFLIADSQLKIKPRPIKTWFAIDQLYNPDTITLNPGGIWKEEILLQGRVSAAHNTEASDKLVKLFRATIKSQFTKVGALWLGPQALEMLKAGKRLTIAEQSPYNLKLET